MSGKQRLPNIILIVMDTVGAKHMSLYDYPRCTTPNLVRIAEDCTVYNRCFAPACWTVPSHASMFTGLYPSQHDTHEANLFLNSNYQHIVSVLKMAGYHTYGVVSNGLVSPQSGLCRDFDKLKVFGGTGFARFQDKFARSKGDAADGLIPRLTKVVTTKERILLVLKYFLETHNYQRGFQDLMKVAKYKANKYINPSPYQKSSKYTVATVNLFNSIVNDHYSYNNDNPYFFFLNFIEAHEKYRPPLKSRHFSKFYNKQYGSMNALYKKPNNKLSGQYNDLYDDEIYFLDYMISKVWDILKKFPDFDNAVVIITSDHGEHFGEKGIYAHSLSLYNELIWVPLIVKFPKGLAKKGVSNRLVSLNDLYSTILDLMNSPLPSPRSSQSLLSESKRDMVLSQVIFPAIWQGQMNARKEYDNSFHPPSFAVINDKYNKIIERTNGELELYDLNNDKEEINNLIQLIPSKTKDNLRHLIDILKRDTNFYEVVKRANSNTTSNNHYAIINY